MNSSFCATLQTHFYIIQLVGGSTGPRFIVLRFHSQEKMVRWLKNVLSCIWDKYCHLIFNLNMMEPKNIPILNAITSLRNSGLKLFYANCSLKLGFKGSYQVRAFILKGLCCTSTD